MYNFQDIIKKFIDKQLLWVYYKSVITQFICPLEVVIPLYGNRQNLRAFLFIKEFLQMIRIIFSKDGHVLMIEKIDNRGQAYNRR